MTSRTWNGSNGAYSNAADWLPVGVPLSGDVATINSGTVTATGTDLAPNVLTNVNSSTSQTELILTNATIASGDQITVRAGATNAVLGTMGTVTNTGLVSLAQSGASSNPFLVVQDQPGGGASTFINNGMIDLSNSIDLLTANPSTPGTQANENDQIVNNGIIALLPSAGS